MHLRLVALRGIDVTLNSEVIEVVFRGGPAFDGGKTRRLHVSKCDGEEFALRGGAVMGEEVPDRIYKYLDGEARFVRWADSN